MFEIKHENKNGIFHVRLERDVTRQDMDQLCQLASNILLTSSGSEHSKYEVPGIGAVYGPHLPPNFANSASSGMKQEKLGERPCDSISMGSYSEPMTGVRIKMVSMPVSGNSVRTDAIKALREATGISITGCKEIVFGNYSCPVMTREAADFVMNSFRELGVYAKIVPSTENTLAA